MFVKHEESTSEITVTDDNGSPNAYTPRTKVSSGTGAVHGQWFYCLSSGFEDATLTISASGPTLSYPSIHVFVFNPDGATAAYDTEGLSATNAVGDGDGLGATAAFTIASTNEIVAVGYGNYGGGSLTDRKINGGSNITDYYEDASINGGSFYKLFSSTFSSGTANVDMEVGTRSYTLNASAIKDTSAGATASFTPSQTADA